MSPLFLHAEDEGNIEDAPGFLTTYLNKGIAKTMDAADTTSTQKMEFGRNITKYVSVPQFGGYITGKYSYTDQKNVVSNGFECRLVRFYVSGYVLKDFKYRVQMELRNTPAMRDYTLEWLRYKEFQVKIGQFKRCFTFENPASPWEVGFGGYSQLAMRMCAFGAEDPSGEASQNGRDQGLQFQGELFPVGKDHHRLFSYQAAVYNGNGQNQKDNNNQKDWIGNIQVQPIKNLHIALFGWTGNYTKGDVTVRKNRWGLSAKYEGHDWSARAEYAHHTGHSVNDYDSGTKTWSGAARADAWYATVGVPCTKWLKTYVKYDVYRNNAEWNSARTVYGICPNAQLHKNLMFQLQYNYVCDKTKSDRHYNELWFETWIRF